MASDPCWRDGSLFFWGAIATGVKRTTSRYCKNATSKFLVDSVIVTAPPGVGTLLYRSTNERSISDGELLTQMKNHLR
jgi:hypothetical protein